MSLRPRTVRRLMVLFAAVLVVVAVGAALYLRNEHRKAVRLEAARQAGMAAYQAGDYAAALESLRFYVARNKSDPQALFAYGIARSRVEEPSGKHILEGINTLSALLQIDPGNLEAKHRLLELYTQAFYSDEAVDLADRVLAQDPNDVPALHAKAVALERRLKYDKALAISQKINQLQPTDLDQQFATYRLMTQLKRTPAEMLARAQAQQKAHPDDPRFAMILGMAYGNAGDSASGKLWLNRAATQPAPDAVYVRNLVRVFDSVKMYKEAADLLDRTVASNPDPMIMRVLVQRLWQSGRLDAVVDRLKGLYPNSSKSDATLLAYRALALHETGKAAEAKAIVAALGKRAGDSEAIAWSTALSALFAPMDPKSALAQYQAALTRMPNNAVIRKLVGDAYWRLGETELAIGAWRRAAELAPSWAGPHLSAARALNADGRVKEALEEAQRAFAAAPDSPDAAIALVNLRYRALEQGLVDASSEPALLAAVEQVQKQIPGEAETLPTYVSLLARAGRRDGAIAVVRTAIDDPKRYGQATLLRLLAVSRAQKLGLEQDLKSAASGGGDVKDSPRLALARAADLAASGKPLDGLALLQQRAQSATTRPLAWQLALAQYKEMIHDASAAKDWIALGDANPDDLTVQTTILKTAASARADREFIARSIDRLKALTGAEGQTWKLERARWLIGSDSSKDAAEAVNTLTEIVHASPALTEARLLLAAAYETVGNAPAAIKELQTAADQDPHNSSITLELARLLQEQMRFADARTYLERAAGAGELTPDARRRIAGMLAAQGDLARAVKMLESDRANLEVSGQLLLAELYRRDNLLADAEAIYSHLLAAQPPSVEAIRAAADFYGGQLKLDRARKILDRLAEANPPPGAAELILAVFNERYVNAGEAAQKHFLAATAAAPENPTVWRQLAAYYLRCGKYDDARQAAEDGLKNVRGGDDTALKRLRTVSTSLSQLLSTNPSWRSPLAVLAAAAPEDRGASEFLTAATDSTSQPVTADTIPARLGDAIARYPRSLALRSTLIHWHVMRGELDGAGKIAAQTMEAFPLDADSARVAANVYRAAGQFDLAAAAAKTWRQRAADHPAPADQMLAEIRLAQGDGAAALKVLEPYTQSLLASPKDNPALLTTLLRAEAIGGKSADARAILEPLLSRGDDDHRWRMVWMIIAGTDLRDPATAAEWLRAVEPTIPANHADEKIELARAWYTLAVRTRAEGALDEAARLLEPLTKAHDAPVGAILMRGLVADRAGDLKTAEECYRRGLVLMPDQPECLNNLAYILLLRDGGADVQEAQKLIDRAIELSPGTASFYDTLARVQLHLGQRETAIATFEKALKLEPNNLDALIGLATTLCDAGKRDSAAGLLAQIDTLVKNKPAMSTQLRKELEALRSSIKASL